MDWQTLLNTDRSHGTVQPEDPARPNYVQDADRISFSAPFRRLANKTQVHPLYNNDHLRHRMIHSVEVASVGRSLGTQIGHWLEHEGQIAPGEAAKLAGIVHAACLAHDIGNPPFGHSGEATIGAWFAQKLHASNGIFRGIDANRWPEFTKFEGNAQGFRILTRLEMYRNDGGMNLSNAVLGAFSKYPMRACTSEALGAIAKESGQIPYVGAKKFGVFETEFDTLARAARALGLPEETAPNGDIWWRRHPLVYLVEAADDICYNIVDLEDGVIAGEIAFDEAKALLDPLIDKKTNRDQSQYNLQEKMAYLRARAIGGGIEACVKAFQTYHDAILAGRFSGELIAVSGKAAEFARIKEKARDQLFTAPRKTKLEVRGRNVLMTVLDGILPVYEAMAQNGWNPKGLPDYETQLMRALDLDVRDVTDGYSALHAMADYVSGMTDRYAVEVATLISGA
ncbi:dNTP triphosphohydrolase [Cognatishimia sp. SS12]|uniref:dGTP triphosphohydrolase n=1 Tax=Cognatishimia sp. SS12 TaxID=2979465 RepID=UPI00232C9718|nr:dNTP triphosphohydrolase [Cognatishimia sp. SS12]MDC0738038.1 dNTP triphosphohydrolase [Cognatishimia sp. SS12]